MESGEIWASEITPQLYLGAGRDASNLDQLANHRITHVLNVADDVENFHEHEESLTYCNLAVTDFGGDEGISRVFSRAIEFVATATSAGCNKRRATRSIAAAQHQPRRG